MMESVSGSVYYRGRMMVSVRRSVYFQRHNDGV